MATAIRYIESGSTGRTFYSSEFVPVTSDGRVEISLPARMRKPDTAPHWNRHSDNQGITGGKKNKVTASKKVIIPSNVLVMSDAGRGHCVMRSRDWVLSNMGITIGFE